MRMFKNILFPFLYLLLVSQVGAQNARIKGVVLDESQLPLEGVTIIVDSLGTVSNQNGYYSIYVPADKKISIQFSYLGYKNTKLILNLSKDEDFEFNPVLSVSQEQIGETKPDQQSENMTAEGQLSGKLNSKGEVNLDIEAAPAQTQFGYLKAWYSGEKKKQLLEVATYGKWQLSLYK